MTITPEQRTYARLAGILFLAHMVLEGAGDGVTIVVRGSKELRGNRALCGGEWFRVAQARLYLASATEGLFTTDQLRALVAASRRGAGAGVTSAWMFLGLGAMLFFLLFLRSRYLPRVLAGFGIFASALLVAMAVAVFGLPQRTNEVKLFRLPALGTEVATALWLLFKGLQPRATAEARA